MLPFIASPYRHLPRLAFCTPLLLAACSPHTEEPPNHLGVEERLARIEEKLDRLLASESPDAAPSQAITDPVALEFEGLCMSCHRRSGAPEMTAPPAFAVVDHYRKAFDDDKAMIAAAVSYVKSPNEEHSLMPGARRKFGLMPALPLPDAQLTRLVEYMFQGNYPTPPWYQEHYRAEHGTAGKSPTHRPPR